MESKSYEHYSRIGKEARIKKTLNEEKRLKEQGMTNPEAIRKEAESRAACSRCGGFPNCVCE